MNLAELGLQYAADADNLAEMILSCKLRQKEAMRLGNYPECARQERLMELHKQQREDLLHITIRLQHYYDTKQKST